jgi:competence protein ComEA
MQAPAKLININSASVAELVTLPGIGDKIAQAVIDHRTAKGPFKAAEDLKDVKGIGDAKYETIKDLITVK